MNDLEPAEFKSRIEHMEWLSWIGSMVSERTTIISIFNNIFLPSDQWYRMSLQELPPPIQSKPLTDTGIFALADFLSTNARITIVEIGNSTIGEHAMIALMNALKIIVSNEFHSCVG